MGIIAESAGSGVVVGFLRCTCRVYSKAGCMCMLAVVAGGEVGGYTLMSVGTNIGTLLLSRHVSVGVRSVGALGAKLSFY